MTLKNPCTVLTTARSEEVYHVELERDDKLVCFACHDDSRKRRTLVPGWLPSVRFYAKENSALALMRMIISGCSRKVAWAEGGYVCVGACPNHELHLRQLYDFVLKEQVLTSDIINRARSRIPKATPASTP